MKREASGSGLHGKVPRGIDELGMGGMFVQMVIAVPSAGTMAGPAEE
ncbi:MAG: hypothetical protein WCK27_00320 [Verrucomicrobiota bacterium]